MKRQLCFATLITTTLAACQNTEVSTGTNSVSQLPTPTSILPMVTLSPGFLSQADDLEFVDYSNSNIEDASELQLVDFSSIAASELDFEIRDDRGLLMSVEDSLNWASQIDPNHIDSLPPHELKVNDHNERQGLFLSGTTKHKTDYNLINYILAKEVFKPGAYEVTSKMSYKLAESDYGCSFAAHTIHTNYTACLDTTKIDTVVLTEDYPLGVALTQNETAFNNNSEAYLHSLKIQPVSQATTIKNDWQRYSQSKVLLIDNTISILTLHNGELSIFEFGIDEFYSHIIANYDYKNFGADWDIKDLNRGFVQLYLQDHPSYILSDYEIYTTDGRQTDRLWSNSNSVAHILARNYRNLILQDSSGFQLKLDVDEAYQNYTLNGQVATVQSGSIFNSISSSEGEYQFILNNFGNSWGHEQYYLVKFPDESLRLMKRIMFVDPLIATFKKRVDSIRASANINSGEHVYNLNVNQSGKVYLYARSENVFSSIHVKLIDASDNRIVGATQTDGTFRAYVAHNLEAGEYQAVIGGNVDYEFKVGGQDVEIVFDRIAQ